MQNDPIGDKGGSLNWYLYVANNPINAIDPTGKKVYFCVKVYHAFIQIKGEKYDNGWGFYPIWNPWAGIISMLDISVPSYVRMNESGGICIPVTKDDCKDQQVYETIKILAKTKKEYNFWRYNCYHWGWDVLMYSGIKL